MKKTLMYLSILFTVLTLLGALAVIISGGKLSPGCALIPLICTLVCNSFARHIKK